VNPTLDFFFFYGSIHTYLSVMRIDKLAKSAGVEVRWRPFNLREILIEQNNTAFAKNQIRLNYNWRDIERRAGRLAVPFAGRPPYPVDPQLLALRVGIVAATENWCAEYTTETFRSWFLDGKASGLPENVESVLVRLGKPAAATLARAAAPDTEAQLRQATDAARQLGIFGSPTLASGPEIFWGDDRLEDAIAHATSAA
jgi:2-hydroxychromene-2-carboxylate isomerase